MSRNILDLNGLFTPTYVGFDRLFNEMLKKQSRGKSAPQYPTYNLIKDG